jgi:hypothetical protein
MKPKKTVLVTFFIFILFQCYSNPISKDLLRFNDSLENVIKKEKDYNKVRDHITDLLNTNFANNTPFVIDYHKCPK